MNRTFLLLAMLLASDHKVVGARFHVGQVVAVELPTATTQYFKVGHIDAELEVDGQIHHYYTDAQQRVGVEWPEDSLRALTQKECK